MRGGRSLLVLFVAFGGLVAYLYFVDAKKPVTEEGVEKRDKVFTVDADKIEELKLKSSSGETSTLKKAKDGWQLVEPLTAKVDESEVSGITSNLASVGDPERRGRGAEGPAAIRARQAADRGRLQGGRRQGLPAPAPRRQGAGRRRLYAQLAGQKRVFVIPSFVESSFDRKPFDLRDKKILDVRPREGGPPRDRARGREGGTDQGWPGLEHHSTRAGTGGFQRRRIDCHASAVGADEVSSRRAGERI